MRLGIVDGVIPEPSSDARSDPDGAAQQLRLTIIHALAELNGIGQRRLLDERNRKLRHLGLATPAGREALSIEIAQLHEIQQSLGRSIEELRGRLEHHQLGLPNLPSLPQVDLSSLPARPTLPQMDLSSLPARPTLPQVDLSVLPTRPSLPTVRRLGKSRSDMSHLAERFAATRRGFAERVQDVRATLETPDQSDSQESEPNE